jgi:hypothetical protein
VFTVAVSTALTKKYDCGFGLHNQFFREKGKAVAAVTST